MAEMIPKAAQGSMNTMLKSWGDMLIERMSRPPSFPTSLASFERRLVRCGRWTLLRRR